MFDQRVRVPWQTFALGQPEYFRHWGIDHVATHRGLRERIRAAVISHGSCAIAHFCRDTAGTRRTTERLQQARVVAVPGGTKDSCAVDLTTTIVAPSGKFKKESFKAAKNPSIDCFYVYPTVSLDQTGNSDMTAGPEEQNVILQQFARFSSVCRPYAPLYRQVTLTALRSVIAGKAMPIDRQLAYNDVLEAWNLYLKNANRGRGVVLVGHSQGSGVLQQLIRNEIDGKPVQDKLDLRAAPRHEPAGREGQGRRRVQEHPAVQVGVTDRLRGCICGLQRHDSAARQFAFRQGAGREHGRGMRESGGAQRRQGQLHAYLSNGRFIASSAAAPKPWVTPERKVSTPFVSVPGLLTAECVSNDSGTFLSVHVNADPNDPRADDIVGDVLVNNQVQKDWGLHLIDVNLAMGNLVELVREQAKAYSK